MDSWVWVIIVVTICGIIGSSLSPLMKGQSLRDKFVKLGTLTGKTKAEIIEIAGNPNSVSAVAAGKNLLQWNTAGYHIALLFAGDICEGVTHESSHL